MQLSSNERFVKDCKDFDAKINKIENESVRNEMKNLLGRFIEEAKKLDFKHQQLSMGVRLPEDMNNGRNTLLEIRKKLVSRLS